MTLRIASDSSGPGKADLPGPDVLDDIDKALISLLQVDGRMSFADLAREVDLSQNATRLRVQRLRSSGVVAIVAVTNPLTVGFKTMAMAGIQIGGPVRESAAQIADVSGVSYVVICSGRYDLLVELVCEDDAQLIEFVEQHLWSLPAVRSVELLTYLDLKKETYTWGTK